MFPAFLPTVVPRSHARQKTIASSFSVILALALLPSLGAAETGAVLTSSSIFEKSSKIEPPAPLTLQSALDFALSASPDLSGARAEIAATDAATLQATTRINPEVSALVEDVRKQTRTTTIQFSQALELGGKRAARIRAAEFGSTSASADFAVKKAEVEAAVITAFFDIVIAQERLALIQASVDLAARATDITGKRVIAGKISPVEETKSRVAQATVHLEVSQAKSDLRVARQRLSSLWGNPSPQFTQADLDLERLPAVPDQTALVAGLTQSPVVVRANLEVDRRAALAQVENSRRTPNLTVTLGIKRAEDVGRNQAVVGLAIPIPLFDRNQGNLLEALRRTDKARDELNATKIRISNELTQAIERLATAVEQGTTLKTQIIPGAQSAYDASVKGFEFGKFGFLEVLDAQRTLLQVKSQYLKVLADAHRAQADLVRLLGNIPANSFEALPKARP